MDRKEVGYTFIDKWDLRWLNMAREVGSWSKDPSTKVGAVAVHDRGDIASQGYNGFPRGMEDTEPRYFDKDYKYDHVVHAERNCVYNAAYHGHSLRDAALYVDGLPICHDCCKSVIQVGVNRVIMRTRPKLTPCKYCGPGIYTGLPGNACSDCMNTGLDTPPGAPQKWEDSFRKSVKMMNEVGIQWLCYEEDSSGRIESVRSPAPWNETDGYVQKAAPLG